VHSMDIYEKIFNRSRGDFRQWLTLVRHFFRRLFINDAVFFEEQMKEKIIAVIAIFAVFSAHLSHMLLWKYAWLPGLGSLGTSWVEKCYFIFFLMVLMSFIAVLEWDVIFLDSRDYSNLLPLPIKIRNLFSAKFASVCVFIFLFYLVVNSLSTILFWFYLAQWHSSSIFFGLRFMFVHWISAFAASFFAFFIFGFLVSALITLFGYKTFHQISAFLRPVLIVFFVFMMVIFIAESVSSFLLFSEFLQLKESNSLFLYLFPPMWFTGLYEVLAGNRDPLFMALSVFAVFAFIIPPLAFLLTGALGYGRYITKMQEVKKKTMQLVKLKKFLLRLFNRVFLRSRVQRAVFYFFGKILKKSILHKMRLATYLAASIAVILVFLVSSAGIVQTLSTVNTAFLSIPLILSFFLLVGIRVIVNIPITVEANWIFRLTEAKDKKDYFTGLKKGIFFFVLFPLFVLLFIFYSFLWNGQISFLHCLYGILLSLLLMEVLFYNYRKIPFACSYLPGKGKLHIFWILYLVSFLIYAFLLSFIEYKILNSALYLIISYGVIFILIAALKTSKKHLLPKKLEIKYEERPEPAMVTLTPYE
jgi:hypothetical protein